MLVKHALKQIRYITGNILRNAPPAKPLHILQRHDAIVRAKVVIHFTVVASAISVIRSQRIIGRFTQGTGGLQSK